MHKPKIKPLPKFKVNENFSDMYLHKLRNNNSCLSILVQKSSTKMLKIDMFSVRDLLIIESMDREPITPMKMHL